MKKFIVLLILFAFFAAKAAADDGKFLVPRGATGVRLGCLSRSDYVITSEIKLSPGLFSITRYGGFVKLSYSQWEEAEKDEAVVGRVEIIPAGVRNEKVVININCKGKRTVYIALKS